MGDAQIINDPDKPSETLTLSGAHEGDPLYLSRSGEVVQLHDGEAVMRNTSLASQRAQQQRGPGEPRRFSFTLMPPLYGAALAHGLGAIIDSVRSDAFATYWSARGVTITQAHYPRSWRSEQTAVSAASLPTLMRMLASLHDRDPNARIRVAGGPRRRTRAGTAVRASGLARAATVARDTRLRFALGEPRSELGGVVQIRGEGRTLTIDQFLIRGGECLQWETITSAGVLVRDMTF